MVSVYLGTVNLLFTLCLVVGGVYGAHTTRRQYQGLIRAMRSAEARMAPVLQAFQDQVLFLKHNLNARAIDSLQGELGTIETDVAQLIREMEKSIAESEAFIRSLQN